MSWDLLAPELKSRVFSYLDIPTLSMAAEASKDWNRQANDPILWINLFKARHPNSTAWLAQAHGKGLSPKQAYKDKLDSDKAWLDEQPYVRQKRLPHHAATEVAAYRNISKTDGWILTGSEDMTAILTLYRRQRLPTARVLRGHTSGLTQVALTSSRAVTAARDGTIRVWSLERLHAKAKAAIKAMNKAAIASAKQGSSSASTSPQSTTSTTFGSTTTSSHIPSLPPSALKELLTGTAPTLQDWASSASKQKASRTRSRSSRSRRARSKASTNAPSSPPAPSSPSPSSSLPSSSTGLPLPPPPPLPTNVAENLTSLRSGLGRVMAVARGAPELITPEPIPTNPDDPAARAVQPKLEIKRKVKVPSKPVDASTWATVMKVSEKKAAIVSGWTDGALRVFSLDTGALLWQATNAHNGPLNDVAIFEAPLSLVDPNQRYILGARKEKLAAYGLSASLERTSLFAVTVGGTDHTIALWDVTSGDLLHRYSGHLEPIHFIRISFPPAFYSASSSDPSTVVYVPPPPGESWLDIAERRAAKARDPPAPPQPSPTPITHQVAPPTQLPTQPPALPEAPAVPALVLTDEDGAQGVPQEEGPPLPDLGAAAAAANGNDNNDGEQPNVNSVGPTIIMPDGTIVGIGRHQDLPTEEEIENDSLHGGLPLSHQILIVSGSFEQKIVTRVWKTTDGRFLRYLPSSDALNDQPDHPNLGHIVSCEVHGRHVATGLRNGIVLIWDVITGQQLAMVSGEAVNPSRGAAISLQFDDQKLVVATENTGMVYVASLPDGTDVRDFRRHTTILDRPSGPVPLQYQDNKLMFIGPHGRNGEDSIVVSDFSKLRLPRAAWREKDKALFSDAEYFYSLFSLLLLGSWFTMAIEVVDTTGFSIPWIIVNAPLALFGLLLLVTIIYTTRRAAKRSHVDKYDTFVSFLFLTTHFLVAPITIAIKLDFFPDSSSYPWLLAMSPILLAWGWNAVDNLNDLYYSGKRWRQSVTFRDAYPLFFPYISLWTWTWCYALTIFFTALKLDEYIDWNWQTVGLPTLIGNWVLIASSIVCVGLGFGYPNRARVLGAERAARLSQPRWDFNVQAFTDAGAAGVIVGLISIVLLLMVSNIFEKADGVYTQDWSQVFLPISIAMGGWLGFSVIYGLTLAKSRDRAQDPPPVPAALVNQLDPEHPAAQQYAGVGNGGLTTIAGADPVVGLVAGTGGQGGDAGPAANGNADGAIDDDLFAETLDGILAELATAVQEWDDALGGAQNAPPPPPGAGAGAGPGAGPDANNAPENGNAPPAGQQVDPALVEALLAAGIPPNEIQANLPPGAVLPPGFAFIPNFQFDNNWM